MNIKKGYNIPSCLELKKSSIHGLGIFATKFIPKGTNLGICHYYDYTKNPVRHLRNPFVSFFNYSINKNAHLPIVKKRFINGVGFVTELITLKNIQKGEEVLLTYSWYNPTKPDTEDNKHYLPLPNNISIKKVNNKYCLYATEDIVKDFNLGISHSYYNRTDVYEPNAIGGYLVESNKPNAFLNKVDNNLYLKSNSFIKKGDLISVDYERIHY
jgi:hypothetical protein